MPNRWLRMRDQLFRRTQKVSGAGSKLTSADKNRPNSKAHLQTLTDRIAKLESLLKEKGQELPNDVELDKAERATVAEQSAIQVSSPESNGQGSEGSEGRSPSSIDSKQSMVQRLLSTRGHLSFDQLNGRLRYFGPTTNCHIYSELNTFDDVSRAALEQQRRSEKVIRSLSAETNDYLMDLYWRHYNAVIPVVDQAAFEEDREHGRKKYYSGFLHICILAMAYQRFADKSRPDMMRIGLPMRESTLHKEAKYMLDCELEQPGGIPSIQGLLLLGDLECGVGRDNLGWLYAGMANRLCFDVGLHLDNQNSGLDQREVDIGRMTLWACVIYDKYWALFLGRPTSLKSADLAIYNLSAKFERLGAFEETKKPLETQVYEALIDLMELAGKITDMRDAKSTTDTDHSAYLRMSALDRELGAWYSKLPRALQWIPENINTAPFSFFLLHQQYHCTMILLHRPFALYDDATSPAESDSDGSELDTHFSALSRTLCTRHAVRVARIFWQHRQRFDTRYIFVTGLQHAGTAAIALVAALAYIKDRSSRAANMQYLECLAAALRDMTETYHPAERMSTVLEAVLIELRADGPKRVVPARRDSSRDAEMTVVTPKRRQIAPPRPTKPAMVQKTPTDPPSSFEGFIVVTPQSTDNSNMEDLWPDLSNKEQSSLDYPMSSRYHVFPQKEPSPHRSAWMGAETPQISRPVTAFENFQATPGENQSEMDFGAMLQHGNDWQVTDLDGWPPLRGAHSPPKKDKNVQSQTETISGLHGIWDEMMKAGGGIG